MLQENSGSVAAKLLPFEHNMKRVMPPEYAGVLTRYSCRSATFAFVRYIIKYNAIRAKSIEATMYDATSTSLGLAIRFSQVRRTLSDRAQ